jgi:hypothetical protein
MESIQSIICPQFIRGQPIMTHPSHFLARLAGFEPATLGLEVRLREFFQPFLSA